MDKNPGPPRPTFSDLADFNPVLYLVQIQKPEIRLSGEGHCDSLLRGAPRFAGAPRCTTPPDASHPQAASWMTPRRCTILAKKRNNT